MEMDTYDTRFLILGDNLIAIDKSCKALKCEYLMASQEVL
jgi:hypothetical protein